VAAGSAYASSKVHPKESSIAYVMAMLRQLSECAAYFTIFIAQTNFSHQVVGRTKIMSSPGFAVAVLLLQLLLATKPEVTIVETG
jgi:hypothetical protein